MKVKNRANPAILPLPCDYMLKKLIKKPCHCQYAYYATFDYGVVAFNRSRGIWLKPRLSKSRGYLELRIGRDFDGYKADYYYEHTLVANAFVPPRHLFCLTVHHLDMDKRNNVADNLIWVTPSEHQKIHHEARRGEYTTMMKVLDEEREFCRKNGIRFERKIDINQLKSKINEYYSQKSKAAKSND